MLKTNTIRSVWTHKQLVRYAVTQIVVEPKIADEWDQAKPYSAIPSPSVPSTIRGFMPGGKYYNKKLHEVHGVFKEEFGPIVKFKGSLGRRDIIMLFDPKDFETLFRNDSMWPTRRGMDAFVYYRKNIRNDVFKGVGGLVTEQGESWHDFRTIVNPVMMHPKTVKVYIPSVDSISKDFIQRVRTIRDVENETPANFSQEVNRWSLESISYIALNTRLGVLNNDTMNEDAQNIIEAVRDFFDLAYQLDVLPSIWRYYSTPTFKKFVATSDKLTEGIMKYVETAMERLEKKPTPPGEEIGVLEKLMKLNRHTAKIMAFDMLLAGVDTTASGFVGILYCLAKNPDKQKKLRDEIMNILPNKDSALTAENMRNLPYLRAVIKEGLRIYAPTVGTVRGAGQDMVLQGYQVPQDTDVAIANLHCSNDQIFFPKSEKFIPERWLRNTVTTECPHAKETHPFVYLPFGFGARSCVGRRFAELEIEVLIARMIREFYIEWHHEDIVFQSFLVNVPKGDIKFKLIDID